MRARSRSRRISRAWRNHQPAQQQDPQAQAAYYVVRLYSGELTRQEEEQIASWRAAAPQHEFEFNRQLALWHSGSELRSGVDALSEPTKKVHMGWPWGLVASACGVTLAALLWLEGDWSQANPSAGSSTVVEHSPTQPPDSAASAAQRYYVIAGPDSVERAQLSDGSQITLNANTVVEVRFDPQERAIQLLHGEAYFEVVQDPVASRSFTIRSGEQRIEVLGTKFNVRTQDGVLDVAVVEGEVALFHLGQQADSSRPDSSYQQAASDNAGVANQPGAQPTAAPIILQAGYYARTTVVGSANTEAQLDVEVTHDASRVSSAQRWHRQILRLDNGTLEQLVTAFNQLHHYEMQLAGSALGELRISGVFMLLEVDELMDALQSTLPINIERRSEQLIVTAQQP